MTQINPTSTPAWHAPRAHYDKFTWLHLREMFAKDPGRGGEFFTSLSEIWLPEQDSNLRPID